MAVAAACKEDVLIHRSGVVDFALCSVLCPQPHSLQWKQLCLWKSLSNISACQPKLGKILELTTPTEAAPPRNAQYQCYLEIQLLFQCKYTVVSVHVIQCHFSVIPV